MEMVDICRECGVPPGVVNLLSGDPPSIAQQLIASDICKKDFYYRIIKSWKINIKTSCR